MNNIHYITYIHNVTVTKNERLKTTKLKLLYQIFQFKQKRLPQHFNCLIKEVQLLAQLAIHL